MQSNIDNLKKAIVWSLAGIALALFIINIHYTPFFNTKIPVYNDSYYVLAGLLLGLGLFAITKKIDFVNKFHYCIYTLMRYIIGYHLIVSAYLKIEEKYWNLTYSKLDTPLIDLSGTDVYYGFFSHSSGYQITIGVVQLIAAALLFFRKTAVVSSIFLTFFLANALFISYFFFGAEYIRYAGTYLLMIIAILAFQGKIIQNLWYHSYTPAKQHPLFSNKKLYQSINILKWILIAGPLVMYLWTTEKYSKWNNSDLHHPMKGIWIVEQIDFPHDTQDPDKKELLQIEKIYIEDRVWGKAIVGDTSTSFKYVIDTSYNQFELYGFEEFRSWDIKGRYEIKGEQVIYRARNNKKPFTIKLSRDHRFNKLRAGQSIELSLNKNLTLSKRITSDSLLKFSYTDKILLHE